MLWVLVNAYGASEIVKNLEYLTLSQSLPSHTSYLNVVDVLLPLVNNLPSLVPDLQLNLVGHVLCRNALKDEPQLELIDASRTAGDRWPWPGMRIYSLVRLVQGFEKCFAKLNNLLVRLLKHNAFKEGQSILLMSKPAKVFDFDLFLTPHILHWQL